VGAKGSSLQAVMGWRWGGQWLGVLCSYVFMPGSIHVATAFTPHAQEVGDAVRALKRG
jgi:hypothetical protein